MSKKLNVSAQTLRNWDKNGKFINNNDLRKEITLLKRTDGYK